jgi:hypothetical protein
MTPDWVIPVLTFGSGVLGGYAGASRKISLLESKVDELCQWMKKEAVPKLTEHNEDLLIHDIEIQQICAKNGIPRASRQLNR